MTEHTIRMLLVVPVADIDAFNQWVRQTIDPEGGDWVTPSLSATGSPPWSHGWCSAALTVDQANAVRARAQAYIRAEEDNRGSWTRPGQVKQNTNLKEDRDA